MLTKKHCNTVIVVGLIALALLAWYLASVLLVLFAGMLFALFLSASAKALQKILPISYVPALISAILLYIIVFLLLGLIATPFVAQQTQQFMEVLPEASSEVKEYLNISLQEWFPAGVDWMNFGQDQQQLFSSFSNVIGKGIDLFSSITGAITGLVVVVMFGVFVAFNPEPYKNGFLALIPQEKIESYEETIARLEVSLRQWLIGRLLSMIAVGVLTWIGLFLLDIPLSFLLAIIAGILTFVPNIGPILSVVPAALLAFPEGFNYVLYVILLYVGVQVLEGNLITPLIQQRMVHLPAGLVIAAQVVFYFLFGFLGLMFATPLLVALLVVTRNLYVKDVLRKKLRKFGS